MDLSVRQNRLSLILGILFTGTLLGSYIHATTSREEGVPEPDRMAHLAATAKRGRLVAQLDIRAGRLVFFTPSTPGHLVEAIQAQILSEKYHLTIAENGFCATGSEFSWEDRAYRQTMLSEMDKRFEPNWYEDTFVQAFLIDFNRLHRPDTSSGPSVFE